MPAKAVIITAPIGTKYDVRLQLDTSSNHVANRTAVIIYLAISNNKSPNFSCCFLFKARCKSS